MMNYLLRTTSLTLLTFITLWPSTFSAQAVNNFNGGEDGYTATIPTGWKTFQGYRMNYQNKTVNVLYITQMTDLVSRNTKNFTLTTASTSAVFGLSDKIIARVTREQLVDFYIDQMAHQYIGFIVTKTYTKGVGDSKVYVVEGSYLVPGHKATNATYFQFRGGKAYIWDYMYLNDFASYAPVLRSIADSVLIL